MKLVNLDIEIDRVCNEICGCDREHCMWKVYGEDEGCNQIQELEKAKVVEAIPLDWFYKQIVEHPESLDARVYNAVLKDYTNWQKEGMAIDCCC